jgi:tripartite ATP-independent transporter DctM subunit
VSALGLAMFAVALAGIVSSGVPVYAVLLFVAAVFAAIGVGLGTVDASLLTALPFRIVGLLEHDLLQALPLYAFIGALLNRLPLAHTLHRTATHLFRRSAAAPRLSALGVAALLAPMNGSVGASLHMLSRGVAPAMRRAGTSADDTAATLCVASTLGVVIPPSLVLLLLGDAMMRAHTEAVNATHAAVRIVNTQDVVRAAFVPGMAVLVCTLVLTWWSGRRRDRSSVSTTGIAAPSTTGAADLAPIKPARDELWTSAIVASAIVALLIGVAIGWFYAVEAAAMGGVALLAVALLRRQLPWRLLRLVLADTMALTGALFALLVAATTFSLVLRAFGTDRLIADGLQSLAPHPALLLLAVLAGIALCSFVLDAFEMIFLVIPLVLPPVLMSVTDAAWVAALVLLVLQLGFLLPPVGYALVMSRTLLDEPVSLRALVRRLWPQWLLQAALIAAVLAWPQVTRFTREEAAATVAAPDAAEIDRRMEEAIRAQQAGSK